MEDNKVKIRAFLSKYFGQYELKDDEDLFSLGFVNSMFAMELVLFLETEFGIAISNEDLDIDNFRTIDVLNQLIMKKSLVGGAQA